MIITSFNWYFKIWGLCHDHSHRCQCRSGAGHRPSPNSNPVHNIRTVIRERNSHDNVQQNFFSSHLQYVSTPVSKQTSLVLLRYTHSMYISKAINWHPLLGGESLIWQAAGHQALAHPCLPPLQPTHFDLSSPEREFFDSWGSHNGQILTWTWG